MSSEGPSAFDGTFGGAFDTLAGLTRPFARLAEELIESSRANRELVVKLLAGEAEKLAEQVGLARQDEIDALRREIADLRIALAHQTARLDDLRTPPRKKAAAKRATPAATTRAAGTRSSTQKAGT